MNIQLCLTIDLKRHHRVLHNLGSSPLPCSGKFGGNLDAQDNPWTVLNDAILADSVEDWLSWLFITASILLFRQRETLSFYHNVREYCVYKTLLFAFSQAFRDRKCGVIVPSKINCTHRCHQNHQNQLTSKAHAHIFVILTYKIYRMLYNLYASLADRNADRLCF